MGESANVKSISKAATLLAERRKYEAWLAALEERRASTPERVFARVRADYESRLEAVAAELAGNADALDAQLAELAELAKSLQASAQSIEDERAEAELRAHVGEIESDAWEAARKDAEERLAAAVAERAKVEEELASLRDLLSAARAPTPAASALAIPAAPAAAPAPVEAAPAAAADGPAAEAPARTSGGFDDLAFLRNIAGEGQGSADATAGAAPETPAASPSAEAAPQAPPAAPSTDAAPAAPAAEQVVPAAAPERPADLPPRERPLDDSLGLVLPNDAPAIAPRRQSTETPLAANVPGNTPIVLKPEVGRQGKTLKCTECGSMNLPTEWYCERCGAELSAL